MIHIHTYTFCLFLQGHTQQEHKTSHSSMTQTRWAIDRPDEADVELGGRKFSANDEGAPMMCNLVCSSKGRHVHIEYCRAGGMRVARGRNYSMLTQGWFPTQTDVKMPSLITCIGAGWVR